MLALAAIDGLLITPSSMLKNVEHSLIPNHKFSQSPVALTWGSTSSSGTSTVFLAFADGSISRFTNGLPPVEVVPAGGPPISQLVSVLQPGDAGHALVYSSGRKVLVHDEHSGCTPPRVLGTHTTPITTLALSSDNSLLAACSSDLAYVYTLATGIHVGLRGLPAEASITAASFSPHVRTRLLVSAGPHLLVYDTARPGAPLKTITVPAGAAEDANPIIYISCSPFSQTLVALGTVDGPVYLVDLEKERSVIHALSYPSTLTTLSFSPEGGALYFGTGHGVLLVQNLRELGKPPREIVVSTTRAQIVAINCQNTAKGLTIKPSMISIAPSLTTLMDETNDLDASPKRVELPTPPQSASSSPVVDSRARPAPVESPSPESSHPPRPITPLQDSPQIAANTKSAPRQYLHAPPVSRASSARSTASKPPSRTPANRRTMSTIQAITPRVEPKRMPRSRTMSTATIVTATPKPKLKASTSTRMLSESVLTPPPSAVRRTPSAPVLSPTRSKSGPANVVSRDTQKATESPTAPNVLDKSKLKAPPPSATTKAKVSSPGAPPPTTRTQRARVAAAALRAATAVASSARPTPAAVQKATPTRKMKTKTPKTPPAALERKEEEEMEPDSLPKESEPSSARQSPELFFPDRAGTPLLDMPPPPANKFTTPGPSPMIRPFKLSLAVDEDNSQLDSTTSDEVMESHTPDLAEEVDSGACITDVQEDSTEDESTPTESEDAPIESDGAPTETDVTHLMQVSPSTHRWSLSPVRPFRTSSESDNSGAGTHTSGTPGSGNYGYTKDGTTTQDALRLLAREIGHEVALELEARDAHRARADALGVRLDIVRLGRGLRKEFRAGLDALAEEIRALREENEVLRAENFKLRRGY